MQRMTATEDLTSVQWRDPDWLQRVGGFQNQQMVLEYFALSPFWDRQSNNQVLAMQTQYNDMRQPYEANLEALRKMTGIEFAVVHDSPPIWIIQKRYRRGPAPDDVNPIATYYVQGENIYQSPSIYSVIANRLLTSLFHVNSAFKETQDMMEFFPSRGYSWKQPPQQLTAEKDQNKSASPTATAAAGTAATGTTEKTTTTTKSVLRAQETLMFRHWMDRAIEVSGQKIMQQRHMIDTPTTEQAENNALKPSTSSIDLTASSSSQREEVGGKRPRKKVDEGSSGNRKKKGSTK